MRIVSSACAFSEFISPKYGDSNILNINDSITDEAPPSPEERAKMDKEYLLWKSIVAAFCIIAVLLYVIPLIF